MNRRAIFPLFAALLLDVVTLLAQGVSQVAIVTPANNSAVDAGNIFIAASSSNFNGSIRAVEFYSGSEKIGECLLKPFSMMWSNIPPGSYTLTARALDGAGHIVTSPDVQIEARAPVDARVVRGPYLQMTTTHGTLLRWRTDQPIGSRVLYGRIPESLTQAVQRSEQTLEHEIYLGNLQPDTRYYYAIATPGVILEAGFFHFFTTAAAFEKPTRIWVIGDSGTASDDARQVWHSYRDFTGGRLTDVWLMLGDNAYGSGTDEQYQRAVFDMYGPILRQNAVWPTLGNHDSSPAYYNIFTLPTKGEAGGIPSGTEHYYSFDYGNIHFICLDSSFSQRGRNQAMCTWLRSDLAANLKEWIIVFWHHPPYSKGSHNSDQEHELIEMRENAVPILEEFGADLVLGGHSHCYERSFLLRGHYGRSTTLDSSMILNNGSGRFEEGGPYVKTVAGPTAHQGTVYVVAGSSGWATFGSMDHPAMYASYLTMGSLILDVDGPFLNGTFLTKDGTIDDYFTMFKDYSEFRLTSIQLAPRQMILRWNSVPGKVYRIEYSPDGNPDTWTPYSGSIYTPFHRTSWTIFNAPNLPKALYRVREVEQ